MMIWSKTGQIGVFVPGTNGILSNLILSPNPRPIKTAFKNRSSPVTLILQKTILSQATCKCKDPVSREVSSWSSSARKSMPLSKLQGVKLPASADFHGMYLRSAAVWEFQERYVLLTSSLQSTSEMGQWWISLCPVSDKEEWILSMSW